jgi:hypothetical protein
MNWKALGPNWVPQRSSYSFGPDILSINCHSEIFKMSLREICFVGHWYMLRIESCDFLAVALKKHWILIFPTLTDTLSLNSVTTFLDGVLRIPFYLFILTFSMLFPPLSYTDHP